MEQIYPDHPWYPLYELHREKNGGIWPVALKSEHHKSFLECLAFLRPDDLPQDIHEFEAIARRRIYDNIRTWVIVVGDVVVATASMFIEHKFYGAVGHIEDVVTHKDHRGKGYGAALVNRCIADARSHFCYKVILNCSPDNEAWYEKLGFHKAEGQMRYNING